VDRSLLAASFPDKREAERALDALDELEHQGVVRLDDAAVVVRRSDGGVKLHQRRQISIGEGLVAGGVLGVLVGLLAGYPIAAPLVGMALGVAAGLFFDSGIEDGRLRRLGEGLEPGGAALCVLVADADWRLLRERMTDNGAELVVAELTPEAEAALRD
jgi:uncharacterized membrane protein